MPTEQKSTAFLDGWAAHYSDKDQDQNPYDIDLQSKSHNEWVSGWCARFNAIKHGLDLSLDQECF